MSHPLLKATLKGDVASVRKILSDMSEPFHSIFPSELSTAVHYATQLADPVATADLIATLAAAGSSLTDLDYDSEEVLRPLAHAAVNPYPAGAAAALRALVAAGVSVHDHDPDGGQACALHHAARNQNPHAAVLAIATLLELGADLHAETIAGHTPLHWAALYGTSEAVVALLAAGADPEAGGHEAVTPMHLAALNTHPRSAAACIASLVAAGADVDALNHDGQTPLHFALRNENSLAVYTTVKALLDAGADPHVQDSRGRTPLHMSACRLDATGMHLLVAAGAPVDIPDDNGRTPLSEAWVHGRLYALIERASPPPTAVFASLATAPELSWAWFRTFVELFGLPSEAQWALVPLDPFPFLATLLPNAPPAAASEIVRRLPPAAAGRLRVSLLALNRFRLPAAIASHIACLATAV
jgi:ankyrin repeat protein